jgi:uncharacterized OB-fold protein
MTHAEPGITRAKTGKTGTTRVPAVEGWFTMDDRPTLLANRCTTCGAYFFPRASFFCRNPDCDGTNFEDVPLSRRGRVWSYTVNRYQPPPPYVPPSDPFEPYTIAAVELLEEKMVVLGQVLGDVDVGDEVELTTDTLYTDDEHKYLVWKWRRA